MVGENQEGLVAHDALVAIMGAAPRHQQHSRKWSFAFGNRQSSGNFNVGLWIPVRDLHVSVRVRPDRVLWTSPFEFGGVLYSPKFKWPALAELGPCSGE